MRRKPGGKLYVQIAEEIREMIETGMLRPGQKLQPLVQLAEQFSCSRATIREALGQLRGQGLVEFRHGDGTYVRNASIDMWMEPIDAAILLGISQVRELVEMQTAILAGIATAAARRRPFADFSPLSQALFDLERTTGNREQTVTAELMFFMTLASLSENAILENALRILQEALRSSLRTLQIGPRKGLHPCREIYDAVQMEDERRARDAVYAYGDEIIRQIGAKRGVQSRLLVEKN